jgi:arabinofuranosyltransferase
VETAPQDLPAARRRRVGLGAAGLVWLAAAAAAVIRFRGWTVDDFYITYRYAENLARGRGFVYNPGERVFGLSDPGIGLVTALLHWVTRIPIEWLASALFGGALVGVAVLLLREGEACGRRLETLIGGSLLVMSSLLWGNNGAAAPLTLLALLGAAGLADRRPWLAGTLAGLAVWIRPDAGVGVAILLLLLLMESGRLPWKTALAAAAVVALGLLCAWLWFGSMLPGTLGAKVEMAEANPNAAAGAEGFWRRAVLPLERHFGNAWLLAVAAGIAGLWPFAQGMRRLGRLTVLYGSALAVLYPALGVPFFSWYILLPVVALLYGLAFFGLGLARAISSPGRAPSGAPRWWAPALTAMGVSLVLLLAGGALRASLRSYRDFTPPSRLVIYQQAAEWLGQNSPPESSVAYVEIGVLGYSSRRPLVDLMGLVTPQVLPYVARNDLAGGFLTRPTDYVIFHTRGRMRPIVKAPWFAAAYEEVAAFRERPRQGRLVIYRRRPGAVLPPPPPLG